MKAGELTSPLTRATAPVITGMFAIDPGTAAARLVTIGDNPDRLRSEAAKIA